MKYFYYKNFDDDCRFFIKARSESEAHDKVSEIYDCVQYLGEEDEETMKKIGWPVINENN